MAGLFDFWSKHSSLASQIRKKNQPTEFAGGYFSSIGLKTLGFILARARMIDDRIKEIPKNSSFGGSFFSKMQTKIRPKMVSKMVICPAAETERYRHALFQRNAPTQEHKIPKVAHPIKKEESMGEKLVNFSNDV